MPIREFKIVNAGAKSAEILVYGTIGDDWDGVSAKTFARQLKDLGDVSEITLRINSHGGSAIDGLAMHNLLVRHPASVTTEIDGWAVSAATIVAMAGDVIRAAENSLYMIHSAAMLAWGNASDMRKSAEILDKTDEQIRVTYAKRTGNSDDDLKAWMEAETWFTAAEALEAGFVTEVTAAKEMAVAACDLDRFKYRNAPKLQSHQPAGDAALASRLTEREKMLDTILRAG